jgi:hypothetical protein
MRRFTPCFRRHRLRSKHWREEPSKDLSEEGFSFQLVERREF